MLCFQNTRKWDLVQRGSNAVSCSPLSELLFACYFPRRLKNPWRFVERISESPSVGTTRFSKLVGYFERPGKKIYMEDKWKVMIMGYRRIPVAARPKV